MFKFKKIKTRKFNQKIPFISMSISIQITMRYTLSAMIAGLAIALKQALASLPNVEMVTFLLMVPCIFLTYDVAFLVINVFCALNMMINGIADWSIWYFFIFNFYGLIILICKKSLLKWWWLNIIILGLMGYLFGSLFTLETYFLYGKAYALSYWIAGLWFDVIHGSANMILAFVFYLPLMTVFKHLEVKYPFLFNNTFKNFIHKNNNNSKINNLETNNLKINNYQ